MCVCVDAMAECNICPLKDDGLYLMCRQFKAFIHIQMDGNCRFLNHDIVKHQAFLSFSEKLFRNALKNVTQSISYGFYSNVTAAFMAFICSFWFRWILFTIFHICDCAKFGGISFIKKILNFN